jgi:hypothetical protein
MKEQQIQELSLENGKVIELRPLKQEMKYFLLISDSGYTVEVWANDYKDLLGVRCLYDHNETAHQVTVIYDVSNRITYDLSGCFTT